MKKLLLSLATTLGLLALTFVPAKSAAATAYAPYAPSMPAGTAYVVDALRLHPTQFCLGFREVAYKAQLLDRMTPAQATAFMQHKNVPVVIGPGGVPYLADGHHTVRSLLQSDQPDKRVYGHILANWRSLAPTEFWQRMSANHYTYLKDARGQGPLDPSGLPTTLLTMQSDPYRSLAWGLLMRHGFKEVHGPSGFFQEFHWGDYLRNKISWNDKDDASFQRAVDEAVRLAHAPSASALPGYLPAR